METLLTILVIVMIIQTVLELGVSFKNMSDDKKFEELTKATNFASENYLNARRSYEAKIEQLNNYIIDLRNELNATKAEVQNNFLETRRYDPEIIPLMKGMKYECIHDWADYNLHNVGVGDILICKGKNCLTTKEGIDIYVDADTWWRNFQLYNE